MVNECTMLLGETYGFWIQTGAIIVSAAVAIWAIHHNGKMAKRRATIDVIMQENQDIHLKEAKIKLFRDFKDASLIDLYNSKNDDANRNMLLMLLNKYEFTAQGIRNHAFEEKIYKSMQYSMVMRIWKRSKPLIEEIRRIENIKTLYQEFEWLAQKWEKKPLKKS